MSAALLEPPVAGRGPAGSRPAFSFTVLGGTGFIGSSLVCRLRAQGHECFVPARGEALDPSRPLGHVVYAIGLTSDFRYRPLDTVEAHVCVLRQLLEQAQFETLTYLSSTRVYGTSTDTHESAPLSVQPGDPSSLYDLSKLTGESLCLHSGRSGVKVARLSNVVGRRPDADGFLYQVVREARETGSVTLHTTADSRKDYLCLEDATELLMRIASGMAGGIFNVASGEAVSNADIARHLTDVLGATVSFSPDAVRRDFAPVDVTRIRAAFGFKACPFSDHFTEMLRHPQP